MQYSKVFFNKQLNIKDLDMVDIDICGPFTLGQEEEPDTLSHVKTKHQNGLKCPSSKPIMMSFLLFSGTLLFPKG